MAEPLIPANSRELVITLILDDDKQAEWEGALPDALNAITPHWWTTTESVYDESGLIAKFGFNRPAAFKRARRKKAS